MKAEFSGYWSSKDKELWKQIDWKSRNYEDYPLDVSEYITGPGTFYTVDQQFTKIIKFTKYIRANPIYPPYYGPVYDSELLKLMEEYKLCYACYDGNYEGPYTIHDRFESTDIADILSR